MKAGELDGFLGKWDVAKTRKEKQYKASKDHVVKSLKLF